LKPRVFCCTIHLSQLAGVWVTVGEEFALLGCLACPRGGAEAAGGSATPFEGDGTRTDTRGAPTGLDLVTNRPAPVRFRTRLAYRKKRCDPVSDTNVQGHSGTLRGFPARTCPPSIVAQPLLNYLCPTNSNPRQRRVGSRSQGLHGRRAGVLRPDKASGGAVARLRDSRTSQGWPAQPLLSFLPPARCPHVSEAHERRPS